MLSDEQVELVNRLQRGQFGDVNFNEYQVCSGGTGYTPPIPLCMFSNMFLMFSVLCWTEQTDTVKLQLYFIRLVEWSLVCILFDNKY